MSRITMNMRFRNLLAELEKSRRRQDQAARAITSGRRVSSPSDDPTAAAQSVRLKGSLALVGQLVRNADKARALMAFIDSTLNAVVNMLNSAIEKGIMGADGSQSAQTRAILANEVKEIKKNVLALANSSLEGKFLFAGSKVNTQPFVEDASEPGGVKYQGDSRLNELRLGQGIKMTANLTGDQVFTGPTANVFSALQNMVDALEANDAEQVKAAVAQVQSTLIQIGNARSKMGSSLALVERLRLRLGDEKLQLTEQLSSISDADLAEAISRLLNEQAAERAILGVGGRIDTVSLFDVIG